MEVIASLQYMGARTAAAHIAHTVQQHQVLEVNGNGLSELLKQEYFKQAISYDSKLQVYLNIYRDRHPSMATRSFASLSSHILQCDADDTRPNSSTANHAGRRQPQVSQRPRRNYDDAYDYEYADRDDDDEEPFDAFAAGYEAGHTAGNAQARGPAAYRGVGTGGRTERNLEDRMKSLESSMTSMIASLQKLTDKAAPPAPPATGTTPGTRGHYCFFHGSRTPHQSNGCPEMRNDANYTPEMRRAHKKCTLIANDGQSITGAD